MNEYSVVDLLKKLKSAGIQVNRATIFTKIKQGIIKPQGYRQIGKRRYPKYTEDYVQKLIACAVVQTKLDWNKVKQVSELEITQKL